MMNLEWILGSVLSLSGWRLDVLLVRVTSFSRVLFVGVAYTISPPAPRLESPDVRMDARVVIDVDGYSIEDADERTDILTDWRVEC